MLMTRPLFREPLLHFLLIGAVLFAGYRLLNPEPAEMPDRIVISTQDITALEQAFEAAWRRLPTETERENLIASHIRQEVLVREAQSLGLDRNDPVIRQRLQQKMDFLLASGANAMEPAPADLATFLAQNPDRYRIVGQTGFAQVYLGQRASQGDASAARVALEAGADPQSVGQRTLLPPVIPLSPAVAIDSTFGSKFTEQLADLPLNEWAGPVVSGYGVHLVRVTDRTAARLPEVAEIRPELEADWRRAQAETLSEQLYRELRDRFTVVVEEPGT